MKKILDFNVYTKIYLHSTVHIFSYIFEVVPSNGYDRGVGDVGQGNFIF